MLHALRWRLTAAFLFVSLLGLAIAAVLSHTLTVNEFDRLRGMQAIDEFEAWALSYYAEYGSFEGFDAYLHSVDAPRPSPFYPQPDASEMPPPMPRIRYLLVDGSGFALTSAGQYAAGDPVSTETIARGSAITDGERTIATLIDVDGLPELDPRQQAFLARSDQALLIASVTAGITALAAGLLLARGLTQPLTRLTTALAAVSQEIEPTPIETTSQGEIGLLVGAFNRMAADLARANRLRQQMTADIAHELRSPLAVISGYLEGMRDGSLPPTQERYDVMYEEVQQLRNLIDDLRTLSLADAGELSLRFEQAQPLDLLTDAQRSFSVNAGQRGVTLAIDAPPDLPPVRVDRARMMQVLSNLLHNALRHTPEKGQITLAAQKQDGRVCFSVRDTGQGIAADKLPNVFQRFYRVEDDRAQAEGQTGIGLAIVKALIEQHGGSVEAHSDGIGHGATFSVLLPVQV